MKSLRKINVQYLSILSGILLLIAGTTAQAITVNYTYDNLGRLTEVSYPNSASLTYVYDPAGNITASIKTQIALDSDNDGVPDDVDNCPQDPNADQLNTDNDEEGNVCDLDDDNDTVNDTSDAFPLDPNESVDTDNDGTGNNADLDDDGDTITDITEILYGMNPLNPADANGDIDGDGITNIIEILAGTNPAVDEEPPVITAPDNMTVAATDENGIAASVSSIVTFIGAAIANDNVNGIIDTSNNAPAVFPLGDTIVIFSATDSTGNTGTGSATVSVVDQSVPEITLTGSDSITLSVGEIYIEQGATALDNVDGNISANIQMSGSVDTNTIGDYAITYNVNDAAGNAALEVIRVISVQDLSAPVVTAPQSITVAATDGNGTAATEQAIANYLSGATALDDVDGTISPTHDAPVIFPLGITTVTFSATDLSGNIGSAQSTVTVTDQTAPVITLDGDSSVTILVGDIYTDAGATASDNVDGDISNQIEITSTINAAATGIYAITYMVSDAAGNAAIPTVRNISVQDMGTPVVTAPQSITVAATDGNGTAATKQVIATYLSGATALDDVDGTISPTHDAPVIFPLGITTVTFSATDLSGNIGSAQSTVTVTDQTAPEITLNGDSSVTFLVGDSYIDEGATASDNVDGDISGNLQITNTVNTGAAGTYTVTYEVSDAAGNTALSLVRNVSVQDTSSVDTDNDGLPDVLEDEIGLDKNDPADALADLDGDGQTNIDEYLNGTALNIDQIPPAFVAPDDITLNATGYLTSVNLDAISVNDQKDGTLFAHADKTGAFLSGSHVITWTVVDAVGNSTSDTQLINIIPLIRLPVDGVVGEGNSVSIPVMLSGLAVEYPVAVDYSISGSSDSSDHDAVNGQLSIDSGLQANLEFTIADDGVADPDETLIITISDPVNAALTDDVELALTIVEENIAPIADFTVTQNNQRVLLISKSNGSVIMEAQVIDPNVNESFSYDWSGTNNNLIDTDIDASTFVFDPANTTPGLYEVRLMVTDSGGLSSQITRTIRVLAADAFLTQEDSDNDGINDIDEGAGDSDGDGIADYQDDITQPVNVLPLPNGKTMEVASGLSIMIGQNSFGGSQATATTSLVDIASYGDSAAGISTLDNGFVFNSEIFDFVINGLSQPGDTASIVIGLDFTMPANAVYRKFLPAQGWVTMTTTNGGYSLESAQSESLNGLCPGVDSVDYTDGLTQGDDCIKLTLVDGGEFDGDGLANGVIEDPGVVAVEEAAAVSQAPVSNSSGSSGGGAMQLWMLILLLIMNAQMRVSGRKKF